MNGMKEISKTTLNTGKDLKFMSMEIDIEECGQMGFPMDLEFSSGQTEANFKAISETERRKEMVF